MRWKEGNEGRRGGRKGGREEWWEDVPKLELKELPV
jgi:hypothetical protein